MSNTLGRVDFAAKRKTVTVDVPELGGTIRLRTLSAGQLDSLAPGDPETALKQLAMAIVDDNDQRIYNEESDLANLREMSGPVYKTLIEALNDLHGVSVKAAEETVKN